MVRRLRRHQPLLHAPLGRRPHEWHLRRCDGDRPIGAHLPIRRRRGGNRHQRCAPGRGGDRRDGRLRSQLHDAAQPRDEDRLHAGGVAVPRQRSRRAGLRALQSAAGAEPAVGEGFLPMRRVLPLLLSLAACSLRDPRTSAPSCATNAQCGRHDICFLGECRLPAANLSVVQVEVRPPAGSQFGVTGQRLDLSRDAGVLNDVALAVALGADGSVTQEQDDGGTAPVAGAILTWTDHAPVIPDRVEQVTAVTDSDGGYGGARISQGSWQVLVQPPAPLPPLRTAPFDTTAPVLDFVLPRTSALQRLDGTLLGPDGGGLAGASVTAVDAQGIAISAPSVSQGAPVPAARVYVRNVNKPWTLARSVITNGAGAYAVTLRAGEYVVQAAPSTDANAPALSAQQSITLPAAGPLNLTCPPKVVRLGQVLTADGRFVGANFQILATRVPDGLVTTRAAPPTATDPTGIFSVVGDPGRWRITVVPPAGSNLPRNIVQVDLSAADPGPSALPAIRISPPLPVVGQAPR